MQRDPNSTPEWLVRWRDWALALRRPPPRARRIVLFVATALLLGGLALALHDKPEALRQLDWPTAALVILIGVPATTLLNAVTYLLTARVVGHRVSVSGSLEITVIGSAANLMPIPGGTATRVAGLVGAGTGVREATWVTFLVALLWMGTTLLYAAASVAILGASPWAWTLLGAAGIAALALGAHRLARRTSLARIGMLVIVQLLLALTDNLRYFLCLRALGSPAGFGQAAALTAAAIAGSVVGLAPAGLGIREAAAAALAPVVGVAPAFGILAATLNRLLALVVLAPVAFVLGARNR